MSKLWGDLAHINWGPLVVVAILLGFSALYSMSETAMMALSRGRARHLAESGQPRGRTVEHMVDQPNRILGTVLVGNNLANIAASAIATALLVQALGSTGITVATVIMTIVVLLVAEITPKTYAAHNPETVAMRLAHFLEISAVIFTPIVRVLTWVGVGWVRVLGGKVDGGRLITEEEIRTLVDVGQEEGLLEAEERQMIQGIFELGDTVVREVMVPRIDMQTLPSEATLEDAWDMVIQAGHSRIPVYRKTVDDVIGVVYARDILAYVKERPLDTRVESLIRPAYYVPESKKVDELLADFRREHTHIAIVLDEYGGTAGMVTIEDLFEEIVGEIQDEYDREDVPIRELEPDLLEADGRVSLDELRERWAADLPDEDVDTLGGFILHLLGRAPVEGEKVRYGNIEFTASKVTGRRVTRLHIRRLEPEAGADREAR